MNYVLLTCYRLGMSIKAMDECIISIDDGLRLVKFDGHIYTLHAN